MAVADDAAGFDCDVGGGPVLAQRRITTVGGAAAERPVGLGASRKCKITGGGRGGRGA